MYVFWCSQYKWKPNGYLQELVFSFHHVSPGELTHAVRFDIKYLNPLSHFGRLRGFFLKYHLLIFCCPSQTQTLNFIEEENV